MRRKLLANILVILCILSLTACTKESGTSDGASDEASVESNKSQDEEFLNVSDIHSKDEGSGFAVDFQITRWPMDTFDGKVIEVSDIIRKQFANNKPWSNTQPSWWEKEFDSSAEIQDYLGCDMLISPTWDLEETKSTLTVYGDEKGNFEKLTVETDYETDNLRMQSFSHIFTEYNDEGSFLYGSGQYETYVKEERLTPDGFSYVVITTGENSYGYIGKNGFLINNGVLYDFYLAYTAEYEQEAEALLEQWFTGLTSQFVSS